jgi:hypothetical protein
MAKMPWFKFFPTDYLGDQEIALLPLDAQGMWVRVVCVMQGALKRGFLQDKNGSPLSSKAIGILTGRTEQEVENLLRIIVESGVFSKTKNGVIYCRRISKEEAISEVRAESGSKGGSKTQTKGQAKGQAKLKQKVKQNSSKTLASGSGSRSCSGGLMGEAGEERADFGFQEGPFCGRAEFAKFAAIYPNRIGLDYAAREWAAALIPLDELQAVLDGVAAWAACEDWKKENGKYIVMAENFIKKRYWKSPPRTADRKQTPREIIEEETRRMEEEAEWKRKTFKNGQKTTA